METISFNVNKQWFELYKARTKCTEYREITPFWTKRLLYNNAPEWWDKDDEEHTEELFYHDRSAYVRIIEDLIIDEIYKPKTFEVVQIMCGYPKRNELDRRYFAWWISLTIGKPNPQWAPQEMWNMNLFCTNIKHYEDTEEPWQ